MKKLIFIFCLLTLINCSDEDPDIPAIQDEILLKNPKIFIKDLSVGAGTHVDINLYGARNGDPITDLSVKMVTNAPKLRYEIVEESVQGVIAINPDTGVLLINDITHFNNNYIIVHVKVSAGDVYTTHIVNINIINTCYESIVQTQSNMAELTNSENYFWDYEFYCDFSEYTFILSEDRNLCGLRYEGSYSGASILIFELSDESGNQIFSETIAGVDDGWGGSGLFTLYFYHALRGGKKYTIKMFSPGGKPVSYIRTANNSVMQFPVNLGLMQIVDAHSSLNVQSGFPAIILGFTAQE